MARFELENRRTGANLGTFEARDKLEALNFYARNVGYRDYTHACEETGEMGELIIRPL